MNFRFGVNNVFKGKLIIVFLLAAIVNVSAQSTGSPNVIVIMTDDQGYGDLSVHGNPVLKTPELDKLHSESVRFTDFHVAPMCTPTRGQLLTGIDAMRNGATEVNGHRSVLRREFKIMPQYFEESGYATGIFGKWHLGDSYPHAPQYRGFQEVLRHRHWGITSSADYWGNTYFDPVLEHNGKDQPYKGYCTDIFFTEAMKWMSKCQKEKKPFFLYLPTNTPHIPNQVATEYFRRYQGKYEKKSIPGSFYGMIANIDENIGKLDKFLEEKGLGENTILIFLSDNGTQSSGAKAIYNAGMRSKKTSLYEGGHRVPLFVRWPAGKLEHGKDVSTLTQVQDLLPTVMDLCDLEGDRTALDGISLVPLLNGSQSKLDHRMCVVQYRWHGSSGAKWQNAAVLWNKWRLLKNETKVQLYDISKDPKQRKNIAASFPKIVALMTRYYDSWYEGIVPNLNRVEYAIVGSDVKNPIKLYSNEWVGGYCTNARTLKRAKAKGYWNLEVAQDGVYDIELRRWPEESGKKLIDSFDGKSKAGAIPVSNVRLQIGEYNETVNVEPSDSVVRFKVNLKKSKTRLTGTLLDQQGREICGAMYVKITRK